MKALFVHDHPFIKNPETDVLYTSGNLNTKLWGRYLKHFSSLTVLGRCKTELDTSRYHIADRENVTFKLFENVKGGADYFTKRKLIEQVLKKEIKDHKIIIMRFPATISIFAAQYCIKNKIPYVVEVVGCAWDANWNYGGIPAKIIAPYSFINMKKAVKNAVAAIYVTQNFLQERYPTNANITASASNVILKQVENDVLKKRLTRIKRDDLSTWHLGVIGNISVKYKGYDVLLKAINSLPEVYKREIRVSFVGGGDPAYLFSLIKKYSLEECANIVGKLKAGKEIFNFLDSLDIYVHPSRQEGLPRVVIEAMSRACPILASGVAGTPELIDKKYIHEPGSSMKLKNDIVSAISNKSELLQMAEKNFQASKKYLFDDLENIRNQFFLSIKENLTLKK